MVSGAPRADLASRPLFGVELFTTANPLAHLFDMHYFIYFIELGRSRNGDSIIGLESQETWRARYI